MAQTGYTPISIYYSPTATNVPTAANLVPGELAINTADGKLYYEDSAGVVQVLATKGGVGTSSTTQVLYNSSGLITGSANMTFSGTVLTLANDAVINGITVGRGLGAVSTNSVLGSGALSSNISGGNNTAIGYQALLANTASNNVAVGYQALKANTTGDTNTAVGLNASLSSTSANNNTVMGTSAMQSNLTGSFNVAVGVGAILASTSGAYNVGLGFYALFNTTSSANTAVGYQAGYTGSSASGNTYFGVQAGYTNNANYNTFIGYNAGYGNTSGTYNTYLGIATGGNGVARSMTTGSKNTIIGGFSGNQGGLDIRTADNYVVLSDGDGNPRQYFNGSIAIFNGTISPVQATTAAAPAYVKGAIYFDTTLNKLRVGGATAWETITSV
jgi:hypothetical protein